MKTITLSSTTQCGPLSFPNGDHWPSSASEACPMLLAKWRYSQVELFSSMKDWEHFQWRMAECKTHSEIALTAKWQGSEQMKWDGRGGYWGLRAAGRQCVLPDSFILLCYWVTLSLLFPLKRPLGHWDFPFAALTYGHPSVLVWCHEEFLLPAKCGGGLLHCWGCCVYLLELLLPG